MTKTATKRFSLRGILLWLQHFEGPQSGAIFVACSVWAIGFSFILLCFIIGALDDTKHPKPSFSAEQPVMPDSLYAGGYTPMPQSSMPPKFYEAGEQSFIPGSAESRLTQAPACSLPASAYANVRSLPEQQAMPASASAEDYNSVMVSKFGRPRTQLAVQGLELSR